MSDYTDREILLLLFWFCITALVALGIVWTGHWALVGLGVV